MDPCLPTHTVDVDRYGTYPVRTVARQVADFSLLSVHIHGSRPCPSPPPETRRKREAPSVADLKADRGRRRLVWPLRLIHPSMIRSDPSDRPSHPSALAWGNSCCLAPLFSPHLDARPTSKQKAAAAKPTASSSSLLMHVVNLLLVVAARQDKR